MVAGHILIGREEGKPEMWPTGYVTTSVVVEVGVARICALDHAGPEQGQGDLYFCQSQDYIFLCLNRFGPHPCSGLAASVAWFSGPTHPPFCFIEGRCHHNHQLLCWEQFGTEPETDWK